MSKANRIGQFTNYYSVFPEMYPYDNYQFIHQIKFDYLYSEFKNQDFKDSTLYLSDPLSEDGLMNEENEFRLLNDISKLKDVIIKFHPRESKEKIDYIKDNYAFKILPLGLSQIAAEDLIAKYEFKSIIGTICTALFYTEKFSKTPVKSYVSWLDNEERKKSYLELINNHFPKIEVIEINSN